jgi:hypothetical protein
MNPETDTATVNHSDRDHAEFSPSALKYLHGCAGFHGHDGSSAASDMGTRIHEALEVRDPSALQSEQEIEIYEQLLKDEEEVFDYVFGDLGGVEVQREMRLHLELDAATPTFGTCDIVALMPRTGVALVADYKTGISFIDPPRDNWQAKAYTLGVFQAFPDIHTIHFAFLVPRNGGVIVGTFERSELQELKNAISDVVRFAEQTRPKWEAGTMDIDDVTPSHNCRFCRHEDHCPALGAVSIEIAKRTKPGMLPEGPIRSSEVEDPATLAKLYLVARIVEEWASAIKFKAMTKALEGVELPGLKLKSMGTPLVVEDNVNLANLAKRHGISEEEIIESANLSLNKLGEILKDKAPRGQKGHAADKFREDAVGLGVVVEGKTKYTLTPVKQDEE